MCVWEERPTRTAQTKISQEELAHKANICRTYIGMVERAERNISLQNAKKIADALNITIDELLKDNE